VRDFDRWFYHARGWRWLFAIVGATTFAAWIASLLPWNMSFLEASLVFNTIVLALLWSGLSAWFGYRRFHRRLLRAILLAAVVVIASAFVAGTAVDVINGREPLSWLSNSAKLRHAVTGALVFAFLYAFLIALITSLRNREYLALTARLAAERHQSELSRQLAESRLMLLQRQVEPHFLFNTLGSAQQLAERGAPAAARLIGDLIVFLRASMPTLGSQTTTLAEEATLARAYLGIMKTRLAARLEYSIDVPPELASFSLPSGVLVTLVENAIKHGIEPQPAGGTVRLSASREDTAAGACVVVTVADTGSGMSGAPGQGIGLANIRERLALLYGTAARLVLSENVPQGFVARLVLPNDAAMPVAATPLRT
jgi:sensor histidine kinase YesM